SARCAWRRVVITFIFLPSPFPSLAISSLQALSAEVTNVGAVSGEADESTIYNRHRRLTSLFSSYGPEAAAIVEARNMASKRKAGPQTGAPTSGKGPSSLFIFSDDNFIRRHTRFIIEWPYPFRMHRQLATRLPTPTDRSSIVGHPNC